MALGYVVGVAIQDLFGYLSSVTGITVEGPQGVIDGGKWLVVTAVAIWTLQAVIRSYLDSRRAALLVNMKPVKLPEYLVGVLASCGVFALVMAPVQLAIMIFDQVVRLLSGWIPWIIAVTLSALVVAGIFVLVTNRVILKGIVTYFVHSARGLNDRSNDHVPVPQVPERSGSPFSKASWASIGGQGRLFLGHGPDAAKIQQVTGRPAMEPVRAYVGLPTENADLHEQAAKAVAELKRAGGLKRSVVVVNTATGSGWVDEWLCQPLEYLTGGDCAIVSMQYSYLFSAVMMISDLEPCALAGRVLFEAVEDAIYELPAHERPALMVAGESLGAFGSQAAFRDEDDLLSRVDGAIWAGTPNGSKLFQDLRKQRHPGSPEVAPVVNNGRHIRFVNEPQQLECDLYGRELGPWSFPRVVFAQHASDAVVWFQARLTFEEPDWLRERAGKDVSPSMRYTPIATCLQVIADLPVAGLAPAGHGHTYHRELIDVWIKVLGLDGNDMVGNVPAGQWIDEDMKIAIGDAIKADHDPVRDHAQPEGADGTI